MKQQEIFASAQWVASAENSAFTFLRRRFELKQSIGDGLGQNGVKKATLYVIGLGFFHCRLNGTELVEHAFLPLSTDYEARKDYPAGEEITGHRIYVPQFEVADLLQEGENTLLLHFGGGWYTTGGENRYGDAKAIYRLRVELEDGSVQEVVSSTADEVRSGFITQYSLIFGESHDYRLDRSEEETGWQKAVPAPALETEYLFTDCPIDGLERELPVRRIESRPDQSRTGEFAELTADGLNAMHGNNTVQEIHAPFPEGTVFYDCGENVAGYPILHFTNQTQPVTILFSEEINADGTLNMRYQHDQKLEIVPDGRERTVVPLFTWYAFRYFAVEGDVEVRSVAAVHTKAALTSSFESDNEELNWLFEAYIRTQLNNMHTGIPSDCPHLERRGYTGDGQLAAHAVMTMLDARAFYAKWLGDISDCQDVKSGHIQYTAPYISSGGGPGAWGCAIVEVPWQYYQHYGDLQPIRQLYPQMLRYFDYLEAHSENGLVSSDQPGNWCLGDWCPPLPVILPAPFVNNYYYVKSLNRVMEMARLIGREEDLPWLEARAAQRKEAIRAAYFNTWDGNFIGNFQGANAFAVDLGVGDERTLENLAAYYRDHPEYDTGICGTDLVTRVLFEKGYGDVAMGLLSSTRPHSFGGMRRAGATTLWEYWPESADRRRFGRSLDHPMFGAAAAYLFEYILGIRQEKGTAGYQQLIISPNLYFLKRVQGTQTIPAGTVTASYQALENGQLAVEIELPEGVSAHFRYGKEDRLLQSGMNRFCVK